MNLRISRKNINVQECRCSPQRAHSYNRHTQHHAAKDFGYTTEDRTISLGNSRSYSNSNTLWDILYPLVHHFLVSGETLHHRIGRPHDDGLDMPNLSYDLQPEPPLNSIDALLRLPDNRTRANASSSK